MRTVLRGTSHCGVAGGMGSAAIEVRMCDSVEQSVLDLATVSR